MQCSEQNIGSWSGNTLIHIAHVYRKHESTTWMKNMQQYCQDEDLQILLNFSAASEFNPRLMKSNLCAELHLKHSYAMR